MRDNELSERRLSALLAAMGALGSTASVDEVLMAVGDEAVSSTGAKACASFLVKYPNGTIKYRFPGLTESPEGWSVPDPPDRLAMEVLQTGVPVFVEKCAEDPRCDQVSQMVFGIESALVFPLIFRGETLAAACLIFTEHHEYDPGEIEVVMAIASVAAAALSHSYVVDENTRLAVAEERNRLSQELHDSLCQSLALTKMQLNLALRSGVLPGPAIEHIKEALALVEDSYADARDVVHSFRVAGASPECFLDAFRAYLRDFSRRTGIESEWDVDQGIVERLSRDAVLQAGRIVGESLANVRKHARASHVRVSGKTIGANVIFTVEDNGVGLPEGEISGEEDGHFGLKVMAERARSVGGSVRLERVEPHGTRVVFEVARG